MPNANISIYLTDEEYPTYIENKAQLNMTARDNFKAKLKALQKNDKNI